MVDVVLRTRQRSAVLETWKEILLDIDLVDRLLTAVGKEMSWKTPLFLPQDECFIVMKLWWSGISDTMERERCILAIDKIFDKRPLRQNFTSLKEISFGEFLGFWTKS